MIFFISSFWAKLLGGTFRDRVHLVALLTPPTVDDGFSGGMVHSNIHHLASGLETRHSDFLTAMIASLMSVKRRLALVVVLGTCTRAHELSLSLGKSLSVWKRYPGGKPDQTTLADDKNHHWHSPPSNMVPITSQHADAKRLELWAR